MATIRILELLVARLNYITRSPSTYSHSDKDGFHAHVGHWHLYRAYNGVSIERVTNEGGGTSCPIWHGFITKREAQSKLLNFMAGLDHTPSTS